MVDSLIFTVPNDLIQAIKYEKEIFYENFKD